jgi:hypothetical protein
MDAKASPQNWPRKKCNSNTYLFLCFIISLHVTRLNASHRRKHYDIVAAHSIEGKGSQRASGLPWRQKVYKICQSALSETVNGPGAPKWKWLWRPCHLIHHSTSWSNSPYTAWWCVGSLSCWKTNDSPTRWDDVLLQNAVVAILVKCPLNSK